MSLKSRVGNALNTISSFFGTNTNTDPFTFTNYKINQANVTWIPDKMDEFISQGYSANDTVYAICQITSEKIKMAPWGVYKIKDEKSYKDLRLAQNKNFKNRDFNKELYLQHKALEAYNGDGKLSELIKYPNEDESFADLVASSSISKMITGNRHVRATLLDAGANQGKPQELNLLPSQYMAVVVTNTFPIKVIGYQLACGKIVPLSKQEVMHDKYYNPNYDINGSHLIGLAPLKAALMTLSNDNSSLEASTNSFQNGGPAGIVYVDDDRMTGNQALEQAGSLKKRWIEEFTGPSKKGKVVTSGYKVGFQSMGLSPVDLAILEQQKWNLVRFCNIWNFPHIMLLSDNATDNNVGWAEKALTSRCAIPLMTSFRDNFNRKLHQDWGYKGQNIIIDYDQTVYPELEINRKEAVEWLSKAYWLTERAKYEALGLEIPDTLDSQFLDTAHVPSGLVPAKDLGMADFESELNNQGLNS